MTNGRGFIALAALIFGRWMPLGAFAAALLFAVVARPSGRDPVVATARQLGAFMRSHPGAVLGALPYLVTIVVLAGVVGRSIAPAAVGKPYEQGGARLTTA